MRMVHCLLDGPHCLRMAPHALCLCGWSAVLVGWFIAGVVDGVLETTAIGRGSPVAVRIGVRVDDGCSVRWCALTVDGRGRVGVAIGSPWRSSWRTPVHCGCLSPL